MNRVKFHNTQMFMKNMRKCHILHHFVAKDLGFQKKTQFKKKTLYQDVRCTSFERYTGRTYVFQGEEVKDIKRLEVCLKYSSFSSYRQILVKLTQNI